LTKHPKESDLSHKIKSRLHQFLEKKPPNEGKQLQTGKKRPDRRSSQPINVMPKRRRGGWTQQRSRENLLTTRHLRKGEKQAIEATANIENATLRTGNHPKLEKARGGGDEMRQY